MSARPALCATVIVCDEGPQQLYMGYRQLDRPQAVAQLRPVAVARLCHPNRHPQGKPRTLLQQLLGGMHIAAAVT
jgi:hypothetical protein